MMIAATVWAASFAQERRYGIENIILKKNQVMKPRVAVMTQTIPYTQYIADYGRKESAEMVREVQGEQFTLLTMMKDGYVYSANMTLKQVAKINMASMMDDYTTINFLNLTDEVRQKFQIEEKSNEQFLGKDCKVYEYTVTAQGQTAKGTVLIWQGLALKTTTTDATGTTIIDEVIEIQEGVAIPNERFELPEGINFMEINPQQSNTN